MRRLATIVGLSAVLAAALVAGPGAKSSDAGDTVRVDALFYNAAQLVAGQNVKVAGVPVGTVDEIVLTDDRLARISMSIEAPFAPFRADAECIVRPQSLIGERFVQCDPGTPEAGPLEAIDGEVPTLGPDRTSSAIDLDLVFDVLRKPYRERLAIILNELGAGLAGRGEDLDEIIRRANPALADARRLLTILNRQRAEIRGAIGDTDAVLASIAGRPGSVNRFVTQAAAVSERVGRHEGALSEGVARLPGLLSEAEPALRELDALAVEALPVVRNLNRAAPGTERLLGELGPFARAARPTVRRLGKAAVTGKRTFDVSVPLANSLRRTAAGLRPIAPTARALLDSLVDRGGTEGLVRFFYNAALATSRFDGTSHILPAHLVGGLCSFYHDSEPPTPGCNGRFAGGARSAGGKRGGRGGLAIPQLAPAGDEPATPLDPSGTAVPAPASPAPTPPSQPLPLPGGGSAGGQNPVNGLLDWLLGP